MDFQRNSTDSAYQQEQYHEDTNISFIHYTIHDRLTLLLEPHELLRILLCVSSLILNTLILVAVYRVRSRITTHYRFILSLTMSDIVVGGSVFLNYIRKIFAPMSMCTFLIIKGLNTVGLNINLMNLMLMACDLYMAIIRPLKYPVIMTQTPVTLVILFIWICGFLLGLSDFFSVVGDNSDMEGYSYCEKVATTPYEEEFTVFAIAPICLGVIIYIYTRIYVKVRQRDIPGSENMISRREARRHNKALVTLLLNIGAFIISWVPLCLLEVTLVIKAETDPQSLFDNQKMLMQLNYHLYNLLIVHTLADPIIYTVQMNEVRLGFQRMWLSCCWCKPPTYNIETSTSLTRGSSKSSRVTDGLRSNRIILTSRHSVFRQLSTNVYHMDGHSH